MDPREKRDGFVFGMITRLYFDPKQNKRGGVELEILRRHCRLPAPLFRQSLDSLCERGMIMPAGDRELYRVTPAALEMVQTGWRSALG